MDKRMGLGDQATANNNKIQDSIRHETAISSDERSDEQSKQGVAERDTVFGEIHLQPVEDDIVVDDIQLHQDSFSVAAYSSEVSDITIQEAEPEVQLIVMCPFCNKNLRAGNDEGNRSIKSPKRKR